jgi:hypothetical protein
MRHIFALRRLLIIFAVTYPLIASSQNPQDTQVQVAAPGNQGKVDASHAASSSDSPIGEASCTVTTAPLALDQTKLEESPTAAQAADGLSRQFIASPKTDANSLRSVLYDAESSLTNQVSAASLRLTSAEECQLSKPVAQKLATRATTGQTNKQTGATAGSDGTTSAVEQTGIPELLSIAEENGSVTDNNNGSTMTLSTSLYGLLTGFGMIEDDAKNYNKCFGCVRLGASATFNISNSSDDSANATRKQVSQWQLKYTFFDLSTRSKRVSDLWSKTSDAARSGKSSTSSTGNFAAAASNFAAKSSPELNTSADKQFQVLKLALDNAIGRNMEAVSQTVIKIKAAAASSGAGTANMQKAEATAGSTSPQSPTTADLAQQILGYLDRDNEFQAALTAALKDNDYVGWITNDYFPTLTNFQRAESQFEAAVQNLTKGVNGFNGDVTFGQQYPTTTSASTTTATSVSATPHLPAYLVGSLDLSWQPTTKSNPKASASAANGSPDITPIEPAGGIPSVTLNFKSSFYTNPDSVLNERTFRGGQAAVQTQWNLGSGPFIKDANDKSQITFSLNGSYERLQENKDEKGKKADIVLGSAKLAIPVSSGVSFPLAVTFANAQEQKAKGSYVIGNFGISFDLDKLAALLKAK